ncbi:unnamed protein product [Paramecium sonneborni]|uniref:RING-type domain-containing protein n=1 Tax=Paramecium sonneborni TaxID=65129 RepID=A0A8S1K102_9CILI|nr:unnamed protein product [Paramecium sonneborni]
MSQHRSQQIAQFQQDLAFTPLESITKLSKLLFLLVFTNVYLLIYLTYLVFSYDLKQLIIFYFSFDAMMMLFLIILKIKFSFAVGNSIFDIFFSTIFKTILFIHFRFRELEIQCLGYAVFAYYLLRLFALLFQKVFRKVFIQRYYIYIQGIKALLALQLMLILFKWKGVLEWNWFVIFSVAWSLLVIFFIFHLILILSIIEIMHDYLLRRASKSQIIGSVWLILYFCSFSGIPMWFCYIICQNQEIINYPTSQTSLTLSIIVILQTFIIFIFSTIFRQHVKNYIQDIGFEEQIQTSNPKDTKQQQSKANNSLKITLPKKLIQVSSTYFEFFKQPSQQNQQIQNVTTNNFSVINQKVRLNAFEFVARMDQIHSPEKESKLMQNEEKCQVCFLQEPHIVMLPCRHGGICNDCLKQWLQKSPNCYLCRQKIHQLCKIQKDESGNFTIKEIAVFKI